MKLTHDGNKRLRLLALLAKEYAVREQRGEQADALEETAELLLRQHDKTTDSEQKRLQSAVEALSRNKNTVVFDDHGLPSVMVRVTAMRESDVLSGGSDALHPAFAAGDSEFWVGKYQSSLLDGHACSLPLEPPVYAVSLDDALRYCQQKGKGWYVTPFALRMAIALRCRRQGFLPHGNSMNGQNYLFPQEQGIPAGSGRVLTGSGPLTWSHDGTPDGIYDLNGNLNEWDTGFRLMDGEIQCIPMQALLTPDANLGPESPLWQAMSETGRFTAPGAPDTLKYEAFDGGIRLTRSLRFPGVGNCALKDIQAEPGLTPPKEALLYGLYPEEPRTGYELGWRWISTFGEKMPLCGGASRADDHAGIFFMGATYPRTQNYNLTGFRILYRNGERTK